MPSKMNNEEFINKVIELVGEEYEFLEEYINKTTKIKVRHNCDKCNNHEYKVAPKEFLRGRRCPACFGTHKKTTNEFKKELFDVVGDEYTVLSEYENSNSKINIRHNCKKCNNHEYLVRPIDILRGSKCPKCSGKMKKTTEIFKEEIFNLVGTEYSVIGKYITAHKKIKMKHNCENCNNHEFEMKPNCFLSGQRCPKCCGTMKKTDEEFKKEVKNLIGNEYEIIGKYINANSKIMIKHNNQNCNNYVFESTPHRFLSGYRCPKCNESKGEKEISNYLSSKNINYKIEFKIKECKDKSELRFDFTILDSNNNLKGFIEYDGIQHFKSIDYFGGEKALKETQRRDNIKNTYCKNNNIPLLRIKYTDFDKIEKILEEFLKEIQLKKIA